MTITLLKKEHSRMRVKEVQLPSNTSPILGTGIDVMTLPEGHLSCIKCKGYKFECWVYLDNHRIEMGCMNCGESYRLLFPLDISLPGSSGRYVCLRKRDSKGRPTDHSNKGMILIHNSGYLGIGCEACKTQLTVILKTQSNIIIPDA